MGRMGMLRRAVRLGRRGQSVCRGMLMSVLGAQEQRKGRGRLIVREKGMRRDGGGEDEGRARGLVIVIRGAWMIVMLNLLRNSQSLQIWTMTKTSKTTEKSPETNADENAPSEKQPAAP